MGASDHRRSLCTRVSRRAAALAWSVGPGGAFPERLRCATNRSAVAGSVRRNLRHRTGAPRAVVQPAFSFRSQACKERETAWVLPNNTKGEAVKLGKSAAALLLGSALLAAGSAG